MGKRLFLFAAAAAVLASCTESDLTGGTSIASGSSNAIEFSAKTGSTATTRAEVPQNYTSGTIGNSDDNVQGVTDIKKVRFGVFSYYTGANNYDANNVTT